MARQRPNTSVEQETITHLKDETGEILETCRKMLIESLLQEPEQQPEGVAVGRNGMPTRPSLRHQPVGEEGLQQGREGSCCFHDAPPIFFSNRARARLISSGTEVRYQ